MTDTAKRYGTSLYELAAAEGLEEALLGDVSGAAEIFRLNPEYLHLLSQPNVPKKERCGLLDEAFGPSVHPYVVNFLKILCENGALREFSGCAKVYKDCYNKAHGIVEATAVSAVPLSDEAKARLTKKLGWIMGSTSEHIDLTVKLDPQVLGGLRIDMNGVRLDGTLQHRLDALRADIAGVVL